MDAGSKILDAGHDDGDDLIRFTDQRLESLTGSEVGVADHLKSENGLIRLLFNDSELRDAFGV